MIDWREGRALNIPHSLAVNFLSVAVNVSIDIIIIVLRTNTWAQGSRDKLLL